MALQVFTARIDYVGHDRLDVTPKSGPDSPLGVKPFAPSWKILRPALDARAEALRLSRAGMEIDRRELGGAAQKWLIKEAMNEAALDASVELVLHAEDIEREAWAAYVPAYIAEMRESYRANRAAWTALLARERVVLVCFCTDPEHCHRRILAGRILPKLGAGDCGELGPGATAISYPNVGT